MPKIKNIKKPKLLLGLNDRKKAYNVNYYYGFATLRHTAHKLIDSTAEIREVADALYRLADVLDLANENAETKVTQQDWLVKLARAFMDKLIANGKWDFEPRQEVYVSGRVIDVPAVKSGSVVYFLTHEDFPNCVKIGSSKDVLIRTWQLMYEWNLKTPFTLIAMIHIGVPYHKELEHWLHTHLLNYRVTGEWYAEGIVRQMLDAYKPKQVILESELKL